LSAGEFDVLPCMPYLPTCSAAVESPPRIAPVLPDAVVTLQPSDQSISPFLAPCFEFFPFWLLLLFFQVVLFLLGLQGRSLLFSFQAQKSRTWFGPFFLIDSINSLLKSLLPVFRGQSTRFVNFSRLCDVLIGLPLFSLRFSVRKCSLSRRLFEQSLNHLPYIVPHSLGYLTVYRSTFPFF